LQRLSHTILYLGFAATGLGMALPGSVLPALLAGWSMTDNQAGVFFFAGWLGTSVGALLVGSSRSRSLAGGCALITLGSLTLAYGSRWTCYAAMAAYGVGLGMAMTSISLLQGARKLPHRSAELNRLNLIWALGACLGPSLAQHSLRIMSVRAIFSALGGLFAGVCLWTAFAERDPHKYPERDPEQLPASASRAFAASRWNSASWPLAAWPASVAVVLFLPTGIEASMGAWTAAYVLRVHQSIATTVTAGSCFWIGLLLSRMLSSFLLALRRLERFILFQSLGTVVAGAALLLATTASWGMLPAVFLVGFGLGPVYPLLLSAALQYSEKTAIFFVAGLGSAFLPWLTGMVSTATASLRLGLVVPLCAAILMLGLGIRVAGLRRAAGEKTLLQ